MLKAFISNRLGLSYTVNLVSPKMKKIFRDKSITRQNNPLTQLDDFFVHHIKELFTEIKRFQNE